MSEPNARKRSGDASSGRHGSSRRSSVLRGKGRLAGIALVACIALATAGVFATRSQPGDTSEQSPGAAAASYSPSPQAPAAIAGSTSPSASPTASPPASSSRGATPATSSASPVASLAAGPGQRTITLVNRLNETIWPAIAADPAHPVSATGWVLPPGASLSFLIPDHWDVRLWARTGCTFDSSGKGHCLSGDCGSFQCGRTWGEFPSTLAEFNLNAWNGMDFYDVSLVEGNNLPMWINSFGGSSRDKIDANGCSAAGCTKDANATCPSQLQRIRGGGVVACLSACLVFKTDQTCCTGAYAARPKCVPSSWPIDSAAVFKKAEPFAYSYVNDDATSVLTCSGECDYRVIWGISP